MKTLLISAGLLFVFAVNTFGAEPVISWTSGFPSGGRSVVWDSVEMSSGKVFSVGEISTGTQDNTALNLCMFKPDGSVLWERTILSLGNSSGLGTVALEDGFAICGYLCDSSSTNGFVMRIDSLGNTLWIKQEGYSGDDMFNDLCICPYGGILATGNSFNSDTGDKDVFAVCFSDSGSVLWKKRYVNPGHQTGSTVLFNDGFIIAGTDQGDVFLMKIAPNGDWVWKTTHNMDGIQNGSSVTHLSAGGYIVTGCTRNGNSFSDALIVFFDEDGMVTSDFSFGESGPDIAYNVIEVPPAGFAVLVNSNTGTGSGFRPELLRFDPWLSRIWEVELAGVNSFCYSAIATRDGGFLLSGKMADPDSTIEYSSFIVRVTPEDLFNWD